MVVKVYVSGISGNKEVKKRQQRVLMILDSRNIKYDVVDIAEPGNEEEKDFMQNNSTSLGATVGDANPRHSLPPQIFNDTVYCGDYDQFDMSNEIDELEKFLKMAPDDSAATLTTNAEIKLGNGIVDQESAEAKDSIDDVQANERKVDESSVSVNDVIAKEHVTNVGEDASAIENSDDAKIDSGEGEKEAAAAQEA